MKDSAVVRKFERFLTMQEEPRFSVKKSGGSTWSVYDSQRKVTILRTVSPNATYNESTVREVVNLLNKANPK